MGQYHLIVNIDKSEYLHPHRFGEGLKLLEFGCDGMGVMTALACLLAASNGRGGGDLALSGDHDIDSLIGSWAGDRIAIIGDYFEADDVEGLTELEMQRLWQEHPSWKDISKRALRMIRNDRYIDQHWEKRLREDSWVSKVVET